MWTGAQPTRIVLDFHPQLPADLKLFKGPQQTKVINYEKTGQEGHLEWIRIGQDGHPAKAILESLKAETSVIIEGGAKTLQLFIDAGLWDEAVVIQTALPLGKGTRAPQLYHYTFRNRLQLGADCINHYGHEHTRKLSAEK